MSPTGSQLQFAAELLTLLTAGAGLVLVGLKAGVTGASRWARAALAGGFVAIGGVAFAHGSLLVTGDPWALTATRLAGDAAVGAGALRWADRQVRAVLWAGLAASAASELIEGVSLAAPADALLIAGSALIAAALTVASRRSIVARVAASTAATLLVVVLVLSVALSAVIASSAQRDQLRALGSRAGVEASNALGAAGGAVKDARFVAADLAGTIPGATLSSLAAGARAPGSGAASAVSSRLGLLSGLYPVGGLGYLLPDGQVLTPPGASGAGLATSSARQPLVKAMTCSATAGGQSMLIEASRVVAVAAYPECQLATGKLLGTVVVADRLGGTYLGSRHRIDPGISLALATPEAVLSEAGPLPSPRVVESFAARAESSDEASTGTSGRSYLAVEPLAAGAGAAPVVSLILSTTDATVVHQRDSLERALFLIALGGTVLALLFAAAVGDRITAGLRRLTAVADRVGRGNVGERAGIASADEVGTLGAAFDSMVASVEAHAAALQDAADDETRLRSRLEAVVAGMGDALVATDSRSAVTDFNAAAEELTGTPSQVAIGRRLDDIVRIRLEEGTLPLVAGPPGDAERVTMLATLTRADGAEVPVAVSKGPLVGPEGRIAGAVLVLRDLRREQELERMKSEFLSRIGHELRTPLTGIIGYADMLLRRRVTAARAGEWHAQILQSAKRLQRVVELLEFVAASEAGRAMVRAEPLDVRELAREVCESWAERLPGGVLLQRRVARDTPAVMADRKWLLLALNELVDNAVKFSPGGGRVGITAQRAPVPGAVDISVSDRGMGMAPGDQDAVFAEFAQGDSSDTRRFGGLGLGLALVQRVARAHGGSVLCQSAVGSGSKFTIRLPAEDCRDPTPAKAPAIR